MMACSVAVVEPGSCGLPPSPVRSLARRSDAPAASPCRARSADRRTALPAGWSPAPRTAWLGAFLTRFSRNSAEVGSIQCTSSNTRNSGRPGIAVLNTFCDRIWNAMRRFRSMPISALASWPGPARRHHVHQDRGLLLIGLPGRLEQPAQLVAARLRRIVGIHAGHPVEVVLDRLQRRELVHGRALQRQIAHAAMRLVLAQRIDQPRLADAGLADQDGRPALSVGGPRHHGAQRCQLFVAPDQRRAAFAAQRLEPAEAFAPPRLDGVDSFRPLETFQRLRAEILELERLADQLARGRADDRGVFRCQRLQPRRLVQARADDVLAIMIAGLLVDDDAAGGDADACGERRTCRLVRSSA